MSPPLYMYVQNIAEVTCTTIWQVGKQSVCNTESSGYRDGTIALLDQMVGTTTKATARQVTSNGAINPATQAAILAAAAVAQVSSTLPTH